MMPQAMPEAIDHDGPLVHKWRAAQLKRLGIPEVLAEVYADRLDWHHAAVPSLTLPARWPSQAGGRRTIWTRQAGVTTDMVEWARVPGVISGTPAPSVPLWPVGLTGPELWPHDQPAPYGYLDGRASEGAA